jgi:DNA-binding protein HU-beta
LHRAWQKHNVRGICRVLIKDWIPKKDEHEYPWNINPFSTILLGKQRAAEAAHAESRRIHPSYSLDQEGTQGRNGDIAPSGGGAGREPWRQENAGNTMLMDMVGAIAKHLKKGKRIRLNGLGILQVRKRPARMGRNPATGEAIKIKASKKIAFRASKELKAAV